MNTIQFSDEFDTLLNSYARSIPNGLEYSAQDIVCDEYEKSVFLTRAEKEFVIGWYSGKNAYGLTFEEKEEIREALDSLVRTIELTKLEDGEVPSTAKHVFDGKRNFTFYKIPTNLLYIIFEEVKFSSYISGCNGDLTALVVPATHDELWHRFKNPFRGPSKQRVLRLNADDNIVELISDYPIGSYLLRYVEEPKPIILIDLNDGLNIEGLTVKTECKLPNITHHIILDMAVRMAIQSKGIGLTRQTESRS